MSKNPVPLLPRLQHLLTQLGENIRLARLRRKLSAARVAERAAISRNTLHAIEQGAPTVSLGAYLQVLFVLGLEKSLLQLAADDVLGRKLQDAELIVGARAPKQASPSSLMAKPLERRQLYVFADWEGLPPGPSHLMGTLSAVPVRGKEVFSFSYAPQWLALPQAQVLDPSLQLFTGPQYVPEEQTNFGLFLDSSPDRWGRLLMRRREAALARQQERRERPLLESDYLLGVFDGHRLGGLRFKTDLAGPFLNDNRAMAAPPWTSLRELEYASLQLERVDARQDPDYLKWLFLLVAPGSSLGGARPKASVVDEQGQLWIAKFPSGQDEHDVGAWEAVVHDLAQAAGLQVATGRAQRFSSAHHTFLSRRFDRTAAGRRQHFASAMTLLGYQDGTDHQDGASYLELAGLLVQQGAHVAHDLTELWRRIVFNICVSNTDDHLRNHGFLLTPQGWRLSPAFDLNPIRYGQGLKLNISETDNALDLNLAREVAPYFRLSAAQAETVLTQVVAAVQQWPAVASRYQVSRAEQERMASAFEAAH